MAPVSTLTFNLLTYELDYLLVAGSLTLFYGFRDRNETVIV